MEEIICEDTPFWQGFYLMNNNLRWLYTNEKSALRIKGKEYFNTTTESITIYKGYETEEKSTKPISDVIIYYINVCCRVTNYFGDKSGYHFKSKNYVVIGNNIYQQMENGYVKKVKRLSKELKGAMTVIENANK